MDKDEAIKDPSESQRRILSKWESEYSYSKQKAIRNSLRDVGHSFPSKADSTINSINPISIPSTAPC